MNCFNKKMKSEDKIFTKVVSPKAIHQVAKNHGFWDDGINMGDIPEKLCLIHSEISEALEALRKSDLDNFTEELADTVIRIFDLARAFKLDIIKAIEKKHKINIKRPYKHDKQF